MANKIVQLTDNDNNNLMPRTTAIMVSGLSTVATSGSYDDLTNKPTIPTYTAGSNVQINNNVISATDTTYESKTAASEGTDVSLVTTGEKYTWNNKQDALPTTTTAGQVLKSTSTAGTVEWGTATGGVSSVTAGTGLTGGTITSSGTIAVDTSVIQSKLTAGSNITITDNTISATDTTYTAGTNVQISSSNVISATDTTYESKTAASGGTDVSLVTTGEKYTWNNKQDTLTAGNNITIANNTISATDTTYTAGSGIGIADNVISADLTYVEQLDTPTVTSTTAGTLTVTADNNATTFAIYSGDTLVGEE